jgi:hypothetical protein
MMLSSCYHGGCANKTTDQERLLFSCLMTKGYHRQDENQYLAIPRETVLKMPVPIQQLMGYKLSQPFCRWVESDDPRVVLDTSLKDDPWGTMMRRMKGIRRGMLPLRYSCLAEREGRTRVVENGERSFCTRTLTDSIACSFIMGT